MTPSKRDIFQWDVKNWSRSLSFWENHIDIKPGMKVLAIGEREGGLSLYFASKGAEVYCTDLNDFPEETKKLHQEYGVGGKVVYQKEDAMNLSFMDQTFDIVCFKSVIGSLETKVNQKKAIREMHRVLKDRGSLVFAENLKGSRFHSILRRKFVRWGNRWRYLSYSEDLDLFDDFRSMKFKTWGFFGLLGRSEGQRSFLGAIDSVFCPIIPRSMRYILFGVVRK